MKNITIMALAISAAFSFQSAQAESCLDIGGVAIPHFFGEGEGKPIIISASLIGRVQNAAGKITGQR